MATVIAVATVFMSLQWGMLPCGFSNPECAAQEPAAQEPVTASATAEPVSPEGDVRVRMNFSGTPWSEVLQWFADETNMSLQKSSWPTGSFTHLDANREYDVSQAMDLMNLVLMREGYALIRRGQLLLLVDLEDNLARDFLRELAEQVSPTDLNLRANSDYVRVAFPLGGLTPEQATADLDKLRSPAGSIQVLAASRMVVATDTVGVLKSIRSVLMGSDEMDNDVSEFELKYRSADEILELARPHLGLEAGANSGEDIKVSMNMLGDRIYATGDPLKKRILKGLIEKSDQPLPTNETGEGVAIEIPEFKTYATGGADPEVVLEVLQRLLAGMPDTRLALEPKTKAIIALARPTDHGLIDKALSELRGETTELEVIQLRRMDPQAALLTINKYFGKTTDNNVGPTVDGDPVTKKLWVKGTTEEIAQVRRLIEQVEGAGNASFLGERVKILPYSGRTAEEALNQLETIWQMSGHKNRIRMMSTGSLGGGSGRTLPERRLNAPSTNGINPNQEVEPQQILPPDFQRGLQGNPNQPAQPNAEELEDVSAAFRKSPFKQLVSYQDPVVGTPASDDPASDEPASDDPVADASVASPVETPKPTAKLGSDIIIQLTPQGMIVASDDPDALLDFESLMATLAEQNSLADTQPTVYWLKYIKATVASELLNSILSGSGSSGSAGDMAGSMLGEIGGGMLGGLLGLGGGGGGGGDGPILTTTGTVTIVPDARLNALIIQANAIDLQLVEDVLQVIDREESPEDVRTTPKPALIPVIYQEASSVADIVKGVYSERIAGQAGAQQRQPSPQDIMNMLRPGGGRGGRGGQQNEDNKPVPISVAVDTRSNSLIVSAPPQDFADIRDLVEQIDQSGMESEESVEVRVLKGDVKAEVVSNAIAAVLGSQAKTAGSTSGTSNSSGSGSSGQVGQPSAGDIQQRIDFFRSQMQGGGGFGGRGGGTSPFGGGFGGRGGTGGASPFGGGFGGQGGRGNQGGTQGGRGTQGGGRGGR